MSRSIIWGRAVVWNRLETLIVNGAKLKEGKIVSQMSTASAATGVARLLQLYARQSAKTREAEVIEMEMVIEMVSG